MDSWKNDGIASAERGENPTVMIKMKSGFAVIGDAIIKACNPLRINYSILMNLDHYFHAHIEARYDWEPDENKLLITCSPDNIPSQRTCEREGLKLLHNILILCCKCNKMRNRGYC
jgi:hypothetical protein